MFQIFSSIVIAIINLGIISIIINTFIQKNYKFQPNLHRNQLSKPEKRQKQNRTTTTTATKKKR